MYQVWYGPGANTYSTANGYFEASSYESAWVIAEANKQPNEVVQDVHIASTFIVE
jgi:hypothetical protein